MDRLTSDKKDTIEPDAGCEFINGVDQNPAPRPRRRRRHRRRHSGTPPPPAPTGHRAPISRRAGRHSAPVAATPGRADGKPGACQTKYIGTTRDDRIDGSAQGDIEYGLAGADYMTGQAATTACTAASARTR